MPSLQIPVIELEHYALRCMFQVLICRYLRIPKRHMAPRNALPIRLCTSMDPIHSPTLVLCTPIQPNPTQPNPTLTLCGPPRVFWLGVAFSSAEQNTVDSELGSQLVVFAVEEDASVIFTGYVVVDGVKDNGRVFDNHGSIE